MNVNQEQMYIEGTVDSRVEKATMARQEAVFAKEIAKDRKDEATRIFKMKSMRADYLIISEAIAKTRAMSADDPLLHYAVIDSGDGPKSEMALHVHEYQGEYEVYGVFMDGHEVEDFKFDFETLEYETQAHEARERLQNTELTLVQGGRENG